MAEFNIHHDVRELMKLFNLDESGSELSETAIAEQFQRSTSNPRSSSSTSAFLRKLENSSSPEFKKLYEEIKTRNAGEIDPMVHLLARIAENEEVKHFLRFHKGLREKVKRKEELASASASSSVAPSDADRRTGTSSAANPSTPASLRPLSCLFSQQNTALGSLVLSETPLNEMSSKVSSRHSTRSSKDERRRSKGKSFYKSEWKFLSFDYAMIDWSQEEPVIPISSMSITAQENALIEDLLHVLVGVEGSYIRIMPTAENAKKNMMVIDDDADILLKTLAKRIVSLCPLYSAAIHFIDENDNGLVNQALAAAMRGVIKDYFTLIAQLESQFRRNELTLQKMWYYLQPFFTNLEILKYFSQTINHGNAIGGAVLSILHNKTISYTGNIKALDFCMKITQDACEPYFEILEKWITEGIIYDPYKEFFVEDDALRRDDAGPDRTDDSYWENRYKVSATRMPVFLSRFQEKILNTGKYLSVIRDCGKEIVSPNFDSLVYKTEERFYAERIDVAYMAASKQLLHLLLEESDLVGHLMSVKHYFFMDQGDFVVQFMDMAEEELAKDIDDIVPTRLGSLLELAIRTSSMNSDPHKDDVHIQLLNDELVSQLSSVLTINEEGDAFPEEIHSLRGYESIALSYTVKWPLTLILTRMNMACYQMLFRHLFYCKYVERQLEAVWKDNKTAKLYALKAVTGYAEAFALRQKMLNFVQNLSYYMMVEVIEPSFHSFIAKVNSKSQVDEISREHTNFVEGCLKDCMLTHKFALRYMVKLLQLCMSFSEFMQENHKTAVTYELQSETRPSAPTPAIKEENEDGELEHLSFEERVRATHDEFNFTLLNLLKEIGNQQQDHFSGNILHILNRLDFNEFYARLREEGDRSMSRD